MSRKEELLKLAQLFYSQANTTLDPATKTSLRKLGDQYDREAKHLKAEQREDMHFQTRFAASGWRQTIRGRAWS
jgi:hypothetical protein